MQRFLEIPFFHFLVVNLFITITRPDCWRHAGPNHGFRLEVGVRSSISEVLPHGQVIGLIGSLNIVLDSNVPLWYFLLCAAFTFSLLSSISSFNFSTHLQQSNCRFWSFSFSSFGSSKLQKMSRHLWLRMIFHKIYLIEFAGPWGPLRTPSSVRPLVRQKSRSPLKPYINHPSIMQDPSLYEIYSYFKHINCFRKKSHILVRKVGTGTGNYKYQVWLGIGGHIEYFVWVLCPPFLFIPKYAINSWCKHDLPGRHFINLGFGFVLVLVIKDS